MKKAEIYEKICELNPIKNMEWSEQSFSQLFGELFKDELRYNTTSKSWMYYDGKVWRVDEGGTQAANRARVFSEKMRLYGNRFIPENDDEVKKQHNFNGKVWNYTNFNKRKILVDDARSVIAIEQSCFDKNENLFNCQNCTLDLSNMKSHEHTSADLLTKISGCNYDPSADHSKWAAFISQIMQGNREKIEYLRRICGYSITAECSLEKAFFLYGSTTRNGKSTFVETFRAMMGDYASVMQPESLERVAHKNGSNATPEIACLAGLRFVSVPEPRKESIWDVSWLKALTGRDTIRARYLNQNGFTFEPQFKMFIHCNSLPLVTDDTLFQSERVRIITFDRHFNEHEQNQNLKRELKNREILSSVLNWAIDGLNDFRKNGENPPACVISSTDEYKDSSDKIRIFFDDCMEESDENTAGGEVYEVYRKWCRESGRGVENRTSFFENLRKRNLMSDSGTVNGKTLHNVVKEYKIKAVWTENDPD